MIKLLALTEASWKEVDVWFKLLTSERSRREVKTLSLISVGKDSIFCNRIHTLETSYPAVSGKNRIIRDMGKSLRVTIKGYSDLTLGANSKIV